MSTAESQVVMKCREARLAERVVVGGRLFAPRAPEHGSHSVYVNWGCRCWPCSTAAAEYQASVRTYEQHRVHGGEA